MSLPELQVEEQRECPQCGGAAEPELAGDVTFFACSCGAEFGYQRVLQGPACAAGFTLSEPPASPAGPVFLGTTILRRPE